MSWNDLPAVDDLTPPGPEDQQILAEIREVLVRHGALTRFGVTLLHSHFLIANDEVLVETVDMDLRTLRTVAEKVPEPGDHAYLAATSWRLDGEAPIPIVVTYCWRPKGSTNHASRGPER